MRMLLILAAIGATIPLAIAGFALWLAWQSDKLQTVGDSATLEETVDCLERYANPSAGRPISAKLDRDRVEACFPPQTAAKTRALIACYNARGGDLLACPWDGMTASGPLASVRLGGVVAVPAPPRAGRRVVLEIGTRSVDAEIIQEAFASDALGAELLVQGGTASDVEFLDVAFSFDVDGKLRVSAVVPRTAAGKRMTLNVTTAPEVPPIVATFTIAR
jgi:hypothetical protein